MRIPGLSFSGDVRRAARYRSLGELFRSWALRWNDYFFFLLGLGWWWMGRWRALGIKGVRCAIGADGAGRGEI